MNFDQIEETMKIALMEHCKIRSCFINDSTGNMVTYNNKKYIITCRHVADDFFSNDCQYVLLRDNNKIFKSDLSYVNKTDEDIDIAVIEILNYDKHIECYKIHDFELIEDFSTPDYSESSFFIFGYPAQLKYDKNGNEYILWMSYLTLKSEAKSSTQDYLYLKYPRESDKNILNESKIKTILPKAPGLSGAFIFVIKTFHETNSELWLPSYAKIVAIQSSWNQRDWLKGCNTKYLLELFKEMDAT